jgi:hypothetical protein
LHLTIDVAVNINGTKLIDTGTTMPITIETTGNATCAGILGSTSAPGRQAIAVPKSKIACPIQQSIKAAVAIMGRRQVEQAALFYEFSLESHIPADHLRR